jgi:hypothetical protein
MDMADEPILGQERVVGRDSVGNIGPQKFLPDVVQLQIGALLLAGLPTGMIMPRCGAVRSDSSDDVGIFKMASDRDLQQVTRRFLYNEATNILQTLQSIVSNRSRP